MMGVFRECAGCAARAEEIEHLRSELAAMRADGAAARGAAEAERKDLALKLVALADTRAAASLRETAPRERQPTRLSDLRYPPGIASLEANGHVSLDKIRARLMQPPIKGDVGTVITE